MLVLGVDNGDEQIDRPAGPGRQARAAESDPRLQETLMLAVERQSSSAEESHPHALPKPDVSLSTHPAPIVQPSSQGASAGITFGCRDFNRASQSQALDLCRFSRLYLRCAQRTRKASNVRSAR